ncbi:large ribosomal subunit protein P1A [Monosporozyma unispora]|nr:ribosomal protein P1A [Kazachstania unispora]
MSTETALSYAALILADSEIEISSEKLVTLVQSANIEIEGIWADIYAKALESQNLKDLLVNFSAGAAAPASVGGVAGAAAGEAAAEEEEEEAKEESDDDMGFGLFD